MGRRTAIVTGASSGIGRAVATALGELGWAVALGARRRPGLERTAAAVEATGGRALVHHLDVRDPTSVDAFLRTAEEALGPADVLVNNAGVAHPAPLDRAGAGQLRDEVETNLLGPMLMCRGVIDSLRARDAPGDLVFISSDAGYHARPRMAAYSATKAGVETLARALAMELEGTGVRSTTVRVGPTLTEFGSRWDRHEVEDLMAYWPRFGLQRHSGVLDPETVARAVVFAVTAPEGVHLDTIEVQPTAPVGGSGVVEER
jgi:NADP-dependent 3-hydroxy acid dehydrogenase YdfG